jgi:hypothetical protein
MRKFILATALVVGLGVWAFGSWTPQAAAWGPRFGGYRVAPAMHYGNYYGGFAAPYYRNYGARYYRGYGPYYRGYARDFQRFGPYHRAYVAPAPVLPAPVVVVP